MMRNNHTGNYCTLRTASLNHHRSCQLRFLQNKKTGIRCPDDDTGPNPRKNYFLNHLLAEQKFLEPLHLLRISEGLHDFHRDFHILKLINIKRDINKLLESHKSN